MIHLKPRITKDREILSACILNNLAKFSAKIARSLVLLFLRMQKELTNAKMGRRAYQPTADDRLKVSRMCALGTPQYQIAIVMDMAPRTLRKHFRKELTEAAIEANFKVADTLFTMATSGKNSAATIFWAKTRNGFKTPSAAALADPKEGPKPSTPRPPSTLVMLNNDGAPIATD